MLRRAQSLSGASEETLDAFIIGGGISGAAVFRELAQRGYRVLLVDQNDFTAGTTQASGMLVWGGLLYLKNLDLGTVWKLCGERDRMLLREAENVAALRFRYLPLRRGGRTRFFVRAVLEAYWHLGQRRRRRPFGQGEFQAAKLLQGDRFRASLVYEEAGLTCSDSRFALGWILGQRDASRFALNHCGLRAGRWDSGQGLWELELEDKLSGRGLQVRSRTLINAAGVWADPVNKLCGIESDHRHVFSKGVYLNFHRPPELDEALAFEMGEHGDSQTFTPFGPVALWGPTETSIEHLEEGLEPNVGDVRFLLEQANRNLQRQYGPEDIVSLRCGVRPLAVKSGYRGKRHPLSLSRRHHVVRDARQRALVLYGGKITSAPLMAREAADILGSVLGPTGTAVPTTADEHELSPAGFRFPGIDESLPEPGWCAGHEACATLEDYLRRRTNIAQWIPRQGLGQNDENRAQVLSIAKALGTCQGPNDDFLATLRSRVAQQDKLLGAV
ncbi:MAG: glycerol-3-phosphate dehydrogenase [Planctomycetota bacterium]|jgi:glycerol-3-phosphate dehydrogenase